MGIDIERVIFLEHAHQLVVHAHRQRHRHARADAHDVDVLDGAHAADDPLELVGRQRQRVAARDEHVADLRRAPHVVERRAQPLHADDAVVLPDQAPPVAVAAVDRAAIERQQEHAIGIAVHDRRRRRQPVLAERVDVLAARHPLLLAERDDLHAHRAVGALAIHERRVVRRDADAEELGRQRHPAPLLVGERDELLQVRELRQAMAQLPAPVAPLGGVDLLAPPRFGRRAM